MSDDDCRRHGYIQDGYDSDGKSVSEEEVLEMWDDERNCVYLVKVEDVAGFVNEDGIREKFRPYAPLVISEEKIEPIMERESEEAKGDESRKMDPFRAWVTVGTKTKVKAKTKVKGKTKVKAKTKAKVVT